MKISDIDEEIISTCITYPQLYMSGDLLKKQIQCYKNWKAETELYWENLDSNNCDLDLYYDCQEMINKLCRKIAYLELIYND